jgi:hypothetical protein
MLLHPSPLASANAARFTKLIRMITPHTMQGAVFFCAKWAKDIHHEGRLDGQKAFPSWYFAVRRGAATALEECADSKRTSRSFGALSAPIRSLSALKTTMWHRFPLHVEGKAVYDT